MDARGIQMPSGGQAIPGNAGPWPTQHPHISRSLENCPQTQTKHRQIYGPTTAGSHWLLTKNKWSYDPVFGWGNGVRRCAGATY
jgi:hypothetical protein